MPEQVFGPYFKIFDISAYFKQKKLCLHLKYVTKQLNK